ncbi:MAG: hypothetical protein DRH57_05510 [Candidatus Cloacimonadota bacterium]|nr:MAG: hypothetical protein DRH57_05510 [Candidatus Cloacimonadota bacterium]
MQVGSYSYKQLKDINIGDTLFNCSGGINIEFSVVEGPTEVYSEGLESNQLKWKGIDPDGEEISFLITETLTHYGPKIYSHKAYTEPSDFKDGFLKSHD